MTAYAHDSLAQYRNDIMRIATEFGAKNVRVFGSASRGDDRLDSDIDLLVEFDPDRSLFDHVGMAHALEELIGRPVDIVSESALHWFIRERVLAEAVPI